MDILHLVDRLEDLIDEGRHLLGRTAIDEERALEIIDQMRISIPEEIEQANRVLNQRDRIIAQAQEEADRIIAQARARREELIMRDAITEAAQNRAANIIEQARREAYEIAGGADTYAGDVLNELESQLIRTLNVVRNGIKKVEQDRAARSAKMQSPAPAPIDEGPAETEETPAEEPVEAEARE